jgi:osmotically-inducible protein OsmY
LGSEDSFKRHSRISESRCGDALGIRFSYWEKVEAEKAAKRAHGVRAVANDIEISLFWQRTDPEIARSAVNALENNVGIPSDRITVAISR